MSAGLAALATALACWPAWPGYMSYDSLLAWSQSIDGVKTAVWPPLHAYLFALSRSAHAGTWGLFLAQTFLLFLGANLALSLVSRRTGGAVALMLLFMLSFLWITPQLGILQTQWRDVTTASFAVLGLGLWLTGARMRSLAVVVLAALAFGAAAALRYNSLPLIAFVLALMAWKPFLTDRGQGGAARGFAVAAIGVGLLLAWGSTQWRLPDLRRLPAGHNAMVTEQFDLIGISACAGQNLLPAQMTGGRPVPAAQIRAGYDPRHLNLSLRQAHLAKLAPSDANAGLVGAAWRGAAASHPACYLRHREAVFEEQMGLKPDHLYYPTHGAIDPNPYGLALAHPRAAAWLNGKIISGALPTWRRAYWLYLLALPLALVAGWRNRAQAPLLAALVAGAYVYAGLLFLAGPAADARYIFPSNLFCVLAILMSLAALLPRRVGG
ncbi:hypothetical protein [Phenylobacterium soli]|uniref:Glycosyltransferase RgtA/B/C/D-like domain-containing protein n=1 Tax=Phenylobacterium soli TaxID=2170551 RepID=A0A328AKN9_9CAUL|nr:hypothetical protein [Phenylobacterium soli]RAK55400.1 hypothetical protein DJ017_13190 [Phenylobacterium soli]